MWPGQEAADWELSKENVQPLRQGRKVAVLNTSLAPSTDEETAQRIAEQRREFELELRTYSGEDPLQPWHQYVLWMEQHCPRGGHEGNLDGLVDQCISKFISDERYRQDPRYVSLWIKRACSCQQTVEVFKAMFTRQIGTSLTMLYTAWAAQHELAGNVLAADKVLAKGQQLGAQPALALDEARRKLQARVASALAAGQLATPPRSAAPDGERHALGALKGSGDGEVPRQRTGAALAGRPGTLPTTAPAAPRHNPRLQVYQDENAPAGAVPPGSASAAAAAAAQPLPTARAVHKENVRKAGPWGAPQQAAKRHAQPAAAASPAFRVYEESAAAARGSPITANPGALAARAAPAPARPDTEWNPPVAYFEPPNPNVKPMYCKDVIYAGAGEVSFEELRAAKWQKENKMLLEQRRLNDELKRAFQEAMKRSERLERDVQELRSRLPRTPQLHGSSHSSSAHLGSSNVSAGSSSLAGHSNNLSGMTVLASPTVNTRDAMNYVREMLNKTVDTSVQPPRPNANAVRAPATVPFTVYEEPESAAASAADLGASAPAFAVYEDPSTMEPKSQPPPPAPAADKPAFVVYEDDCGAEAEHDSDQENRPPAGCPPPPPRRRPSAVLTDAPDIATEPLPEPFAAPAPPEPPRAAAPGGQAARGARRPLQFDDELTGFVPLSEDVSFADGDLSQFAAAAGRVASTPLVLPGAPAAGRGRREEEEGDFTANLKAVAGLARPGPRVTPPDGAGLTPILEHSRERFKSSSSSSGSDMSRQSRCGDLSAPVASQRRQRSGADGTLPPPPARGPPPLLTQSSGYLGDRSGSVRPAADTSHSMARRPDPADVSNVSAPDVSQARASPDVSAALPPAELSAALAAPPPALLSPLPPPPAEMSALPPPDQASPLPVPGDVSAVPPPAEMSPLPPPAEVSALPPPAEMSPLPPPAEVSALAPPAEVSALAPPVEPSDAMSALSLEEPPAEHPDPWDEQLIATLLQRLPQPVQKRERYQRTAGKLPNFSHKQIDFNGQRLALTLIGEGAYARVYYAADKEGGRVLCLKVQPTGGDWEFYVVDELLRRLTAADGAPPEFVMPVERMVAFDNGSVLCTEFEQAGSLLDVSNKLRRTYDKFFESLAMLFTAEMLGAVEAIHSAGVIHGDVKPDNFLVRSGSLQEMDRLMEALRAGERPQLLQLIDFGRAIDTTLLPPGTTFTRVVKTDGFTCPEMLDGRPWTFQTDLYGVIASAHVLLFGSYMKLVKTADGRWSLSGRFKRFWSVDLWSEFFATFLNVESCSAPPDLAAWRRRFLEKALAARDIGDCLGWLSLCLKQR